MTKFMAIIACIFCALDALFAPFTAEETIDALFFVTGSIGWLFFAAMIFFELEEK